MRLLQSTGLSRFVFFAPRRAALVTLLFCAALPASGCGDSSSGDGTGGSTTTTTGTSTGQPACTPDGNACDVAGDCCSSSCVGGLCKAQPSCLPDGAQCWMPDSPPCCEGFCDTDVCGGLCQHDGGTCSVPADCCSGVCEAGACSPCRNEGESCAGGNACCGTTLACLADTCTACLPQGAACTMTEACCQDAGQLACEGGTCCRPQGTACSVPEDCCSGSCDAGFCASR